MASRQEEVPIPRQGNLFSFSELEELPGFTPRPSRTAHSSPVVNTKKLRGLEAPILTGLTVVGPEDIPQISQTTSVPKRLIAFSERKQCTPEHGDWVHFYEDDYRFRSIWQSPHRHLPRLRQFTGVITPDFSLYSNMPAAMKKWSTFRNYAIGAWLQREGVDVIANVRMSGTDSAFYTLAAAPRHSTLALSLHGCISDPINRKEVRQEIRWICDDRAPSALVVYGPASDDLLTYPLEHGVNVYRFPADSRHRSSHREAA